MMIISFNFLCDTHADRKEKVRTAKKFKYSSISKNIIILLIRVVQLISGGVYLGGHYLTLPSVSVLKIPMINLSSGSLQIPSTNITAPSSTRKIYITCQSFANRTSLYLWLLCQSASSTSSRPVGCLVHMGSKKPKPVCRWPQT